MRQISCICAAAALLMLASPAWALPATTWVAPAGVDAGACQAAAPCRTFQFAINGTAAGGIVNVLASGEFGPVTISKSISIVAVGAEGAIRSALRGAGIVITGPGVEVFLQGIKIDLSGTSNDGIEFLSGAALHLQDCTVRSSRDGIRFAPSSGTSELYVSNTKITNVAMQGIDVLPTGGAAAHVEIDRTIVENAGNSGMSFVTSSGSIAATVRESVSSGNQAYGLYAAGTALVPVKVMVDRTSVANTSGTGISADGATIRIGNSVVSGNNQGLSASGPGSAIESYGSNRIVGNTANGAPTATIAYK